MSDPRGIQWASLEKAVSQMPAAVIVVEAPSGKIIFRNERAREIREQSSSQARAQRLEDADGFEIHRPSRRPYEVEEWPLMRSIRSGEEVRGEEFGYPLADGSWLWMSCNSSPIYDEEGRIVAGVLVAQDITGQKRAEEALQESSRRTENILESITDEFFAVDRQWRFTYINDRALRSIQTLKGDAELSREEILGKNQWEVVPEVVGSVFYQKYHEAMREQKTVHFEAYSPFSDRWGEVHAYPTEEGLSVYAQDITERKRAEEEHRYHAYLLENIHDTVIATNEQLLVTAWNKGAEEMYGWRADEVLGRNLWEVAPTDLSEEQRAHALRELSERGRFRTEAITYGKDGTPVYVEGITIALRDEEEGRITGYVNIRRDISERKLAEEELKESEGRFRSTFENAPIGMALVSLENHYLQVNQALCEMLGYSQEELHSRRSLDITHPDDREASSARTQALLEGAIDRDLLEKRYVRKDGGIVWALSSVSLMRDSGGDPAYFLSQYQNITDRKHAEEELRESGRRTESILESITDAFWSVDTEWRFTYVNDRALATMRALKNNDGLTREDVLDKDAWELFPMVVGTVFEHNYRKAVRTQVPLNFEEFLLPDGPWFEVHLYPSGDGLSAYFEDVTERKRYEEEKETRGRQQAAVAELGLAALAAQDLDSLMDEVVACVAWTLGVEYAKIVELLPGGEELLLRSGIGFEEELVGRATESAGLGSQAGYTLLSEEPVIAEDFGAETRFRPPPLAHERGAQSGVSVVIHGREEPFGVLGAFATRHRSFSEDDANFMQAVANVLSTAIERQGTEERVEESREAERSRIARDLHDEALQELTDAVHHAQRLQSTSEDSGSSLQLVRLLATLNRIGPQLRGAIYDLRLEGEQERSFPELLESLVELHRTMAPDSAIDLEIHDGVLSGSLGERGRQLLRIIGEALTNGRRHSGAHNIRVGVGVTEEKLWVEIEDDGVGFDAAQEDSERAASATGGLGVRGMRERARALGGGLRIESVPQGGTRVHFEMPLSVRREEPEEEVRILLVEDHATVREAIASTFEGEAGFEVVGQAGSLSEARKMLGAVPVDVAVIDLGLPDGYGGDLIRDVRETYPGAQSLVLSASLDREEIARAVESGAAGVIHKTARLEEVVDSARRLRRGETLMSLEEVVRLLRFASSKREEEHEARQAIASLTPREVEVLQALALGLDSRQIAGKLHISLRTERNHMASILSKLGVHSQLQALVFAARHGVVEIH